MLALAVFPSFVATESCRIFFFASERFSIRKGELMRKAHSWRGGKEEDNELTGGGGKKTLKHTYGRTKAMTTKGERIERQGRQGSRRAAEPPPVP